ncbi:MAG: GatB/YqeY domain-containing protein [Cryomorphaceae bacterium]|nr:MAG: GatB/YqeY domain-containing protein [Cryomorphaceae bacterium]
MSLKDKINLDIKSAMKEKDSIKLESLRAIKSAIILFETKDSSSYELEKSDEIKILQKLVKQRKESAQIFESQKRNDLAETEIIQSEFISKYLPKQMNIKEIEDIVLKIIEQTNSNGIKDMGKVMGMASKELLGKADGKTISEIIRKNLSN